MARRLVWGSLVVLLAVFVWRGRAGTTSGPSASEEASLRGTDEAPAPPPRELDVPIDPARVTRRIMLCDDVHPRHVDVVLPDAPPPEAGYPMVIVNDGQDMLEAYRFVHAHDRLVRAGIIEPHVFVGVESTVDREAEYALSQASFDALEGRLADGAGAEAPDADRSDADGRDADGTNAAGTDADGADTDGTDGDEIGARSTDQAYVDCLVTRLPRLVAELAPVDPRPERTAVVGFSLGGISALHLALRHPAHVGRVACLSGSLWWANRRLLSTFRAAPRLPTRLYVDVGTMEGEEGEEVPYMLADARALRGIAIERGMKLGESLGYYEAPTAHHSPEALGDRAESILAFFLSDRRFDLDRPRAAHLWVLAPVLRPQDRTIVSLELELESGVRMTAPSERASYEIDGDAIVGVTPAGIVRARTRRPGTTTLVARYAGIERRARVRVMP